MREIKFRGIDSDGQWIYGSLIQVEPHKDYRGYKWEYGIHKPSFYDRTSHLSWVLAVDYVKTETIGKYTGLRDRSKFKKPLVPPFEIKRVDNVHYYYKIDSDLTIIPETEYFRVIDEVYFKNGNYFNTKEQAEYAAGKVKELLLSMRKEVSNE